MAKGKRLYRIRFQEKGEKEPIAVTVASFGPSDYFGLVCLSDFVFRDASKLVVTPGEDEAKKRYEGTDKLHLPYHVLLSVEEYFEDEPALQSVSVLSTKDARDDSGPGTRTD